MSTPGESTPAHWDAAYTAGDTTRGWYQSQATMSLHLIESTDLPATSSIVDVGSGASVLVDDLLAAGYSDITCMDHSPVGLQVARDRLGDRARDVDWIVADLLKKPGESVQSYEPVVRLCDVSQIRLVANLPDAAASLLMVGDTVPLRFAAAPEPLFTWDAWQAAKRLSLKWTLPAGTASLNSNQFLADAQALMASTSAYTASGPNPAGTVYTVERSTAEVATALAASPKVLEATYYLPYVSHACLEVLNCTVDHVAGTRCEVWAPTQSAKSALTLVMALTGLPESKVIIHTTFLGGGLGRKAELDFISQAVQVAMAVGKPVKLMWPREEDFTHDQYRPMGLVRVRAGLDASGYVTGWSYRNVSPSILAQRGAVLGAKGDSQGYEASHDLPYTFGARLTEWVPHASPIPVGFWRSVGASINTFAVESMMDELAAAAGQDPYAFRRARLTDPRWIAVLERVAQLSGWGTAAPAGRARGIAIGAAFNTIVAQVVEVSATTTGPKVTRVWVAVDCTLVVNPGSVEAQIVGGVVHAINATLFGQQTFINGAAQAKNFNSNRMIRLNEMPQVQVALMPSALADRTRPLGGVGELGVPTFAPALANAWARLSGKRVRTLPFYPGATMGG